MFTNREEAGLQLAQRLLHLRAQEPDDPVVLGLPRGGVVIAALIAEALDAPLDVLVVRKLGAPGQPELALGAVTDGDRPQHIFNQRLIRTLRVGEEYLGTEIEQQLAEVRRRQTLYRSGRAGEPVAGRWVIVADDGIATGATVRAGIQALRQGDVRRMVLAVPVAPAETAQALGAEVDDFVCLEAPVVFTAVGAFYEDFRQTTDDEVIALLDAATRRRGLSAP